MNIPEPRKIICPVCGTDKWIPNAEVWSEYPAVVLVRGKTPVEWKDPVSASSSIKPRVCGECGYIALFAGNPQLLWETSRKIAR